MYDDREAAGWVTLALLPLLMMLAVVARGATEGSGDVDDRTVVVQTSLAGSSSVGGGVGRFDTNRYDGSVATGRSLTRVHTDPVGDLDGDDRPDQASVGPAGGVVVVSTRYGVLSAKVDTSRPLRVMGSVADPSREGARLLVLAESAGGSADGMPVPVPVPALRIAHGRLVVTAATYASELGEG